MLLDLREADLPALLDAIPTRVALVDRTLHYRYANAEYAAFFGWDAAAMPGVPLAAVTGQLAVEQAQHYADRALAGEPCAFSGWFHYAAQGPRFIQSAYVPHRDSTGLVVGYFILSRDRTALRQGENKLVQQLDALHASEVTKSAVIASALDCIVVIDEAGCVVDFNPASELTFGYASADAIGRPIAELIVPPHLRQRHAAGMARYRATGDARMIGRRVEMEAMHADGRVFPVELAIAEVALPGRRLFTAYLRDLTGVKAAEAEISRQQESLQQSEKMAAFGSLLAGVAHELNNPLAIVIGNAMMLREDATAMEAKGLAARARIIEAAADRCGRIVRTFLAMARRSKSVLRPVAIGQLITGALELLSYGLRADGVAVTVDLPANLPEVMGDPDQLNQVLVNIVTNAQQALTAIAGPRRIGITAQFDDGWIALGITDNGPGVPGDLRRRIFDPFFTTKPVGAGTGIGLAVSRGIVESHGGHLILAEMTEPGARFEIRLPCATGPGAAPGADHRPHRTIGQRPGRSVLIVDDEPEVASVLAQMLARDGHHCVVADSGSQAITRLGERDYDAVLCDLHMPGADGPALFAWLSRHRPDLCRRTAFVTGDTLGHGGSAFLAQSGRPVLEKPFRPEEVARLMEQLGG